MKKRRYIPALLLAAALAACGAAPAEPAPTATAAPAGTAAAGETAAPENAFSVGQLYRLSDTCGGYWGCNTGDAYYEYARVAPEGSAGLILKTDYAAGTQSCVCRVPGCTHDTPACPAYIEDWARTNLFAVGDTLYLSYAGFSAADRAAYISQAGLEGQISPADAETWQKSFAYLQAKPSFVEKLDADGCGRTRVITFPDDIDWDTNFNWCDGAALYGFYCRETLDGESIPRGVRADLTTGRLDTFPLLAREAVAGVYGNRFLVRRTVTDEPLPAAYGTDAYYAAIQNSITRYSLLDAATGARELLLDRPYDAVMGDSAFLALYKDTFYFQQATVAANYDVEHSWIESCAMRGGEPQPFVDPMLYKNMWASGVVTGVMPPARQAEWPWLTFFASGSTPAGDRTVFCNLDTGEQLEVSQRQLRDGFSQPVSLMAQTNDGRWLIGYAPYSGTHNDRCRYGLIAPEDFLRGGESYEPIEMFETPGY